ncbi:MAG: hypothetical protein WA688_02030 [Thermoplasmata archaeon]
MLADVDFFALGLLFGLAFVIIVFLVTLWRVRRRERRFNAVARPELFDQR